MEDKFRNKIREIREKQFPGRSVRSLTELIPFFGDNFFAYISKVEAGALPSIDVFKKFKDAYRLTSYEFEVLAQSYMKQKFEDEFSNDAHRVGVSVAPVLFRKTKKK